MSNNSKSQGDETKTLYVRNVPNRVWTAAKVGAAEKGITLREWVIEAVCEKAELETIEDE